MGPIIDDFSGKHAFIYDFLSQLMKVETICRLALKAKASFEKLRMKKTL